MDKPTNEELCLLASKSNLTDFAIATLPSYEPNWHHEEIAKKLMMIERGEIDRLMIFVPPRHGKSELATIRFPAWYLGKNADKNVISASYNQDFAGDFGRKVRDLIKEPVYKAIFRDVSLKEDSTSVGRWHTNQGGMYIATGVGGSLTGRGGNILIIDDPIKNREDADSPVYREKVWRWYTSTAYTRLEKGGAVVLILTRWHDDDLAGRLLDKLKKGEGDNWEVIEYPAIAIQDEKHRKAGEALWSEKYDIEALNRIKRATPPEDFSALYQLQPISEESQEFKRSYFQYYEEQPKLTRKIIAVDPAISQKQTADFTAISVIGSAADNKVYDLDYVKKRMLPDEIIDEIFRMVDKWKPDVVGVENVLYQKMLILEIRKLMEIRNKFFVLREIKPAGEKNARIRSSLQARYANGSVYHRSSSHELEEELLRFPMGTHDDLIDAMSMAFGILLVDFERDGEPLSYDGTSNRDPESDFAKRFPDQHDDLPLTYK